MLQTYESSVIDRLTDGNPHQTKSAVNNSMQIGRDHLEQIRNNIQNILNTRRYSYRYPAHLTELNSSLLSYGIDDFIGTELSAQEDKAKFCQMLQTTLEIFEPRLSNIHVEFDNNDKKPGILCIKIRAQVLLSSEIEAIIFETQINRKTRHINISSYLDLTE